MGHIKMIPQTPSEGYDWLYEDREKDDRYFTTFIVRPEGTKPWLECTQSEKEIWESKHQPEEMEEE